MNGERRFYLYNDLRVVFPQRHSDTDEGKVCDYGFTYVTLPPNNPPQFQLLFFDMY